MLQELGRHFAAGGSFAFETTLSGRGYVPHIRAWQTAGYAVKLIFLRLDSPEEAIARVAQRVLKEVTTSGGHYSPTLCGGAGQLSHAVRATGGFLGLDDNGGPKPVLLDWSEEP